MINCPNCGKSYYKELFNASTAMYYPPIFKDGVNINPNGNINTTYCQCMNCNSYFNYYTELGSMEIKYGNCSSN